MPAKTAHAGLYSEGGCEHWLRNRFFLPKTSGKPMAYWLMKSEPDEVSIDDVAAAPARTVIWFGVRNYQARNFMRDEMRIGDQVLFYHSSCPEPGIAGVVAVCSKAYPDPTQFVPDSPYYDDTSTEAEPRWVSIDVRLVRKTALLSLKDLRAFPELEGMRLLAKGNRLSVMPVEPAEWNFIMEQLLAA
jgi:predicted RNA-binding protein with PUA-like domain